METKENIEMIRYKVPQDVLIDILRILIGNKIKYRIEAVKERENIVILQAYFTLTENHLHAQQNIEKILEDYGHYLKGIVKDGILFTDEEDN